MSILFLPILSAGTKKRKVKHSPQWDESVGQGCSSIELLTVSHRSHQRKLKRSLLKSQSGSQRKCALRCDQLAYSQDGEFIQGNYSFRSKGSKGVRSKCFTIRTHRHTENTNFFRDHNFSEFFVFPL